MARTKLVGQKKVTKIYNAEGEPTKQLVIDTLTRDVDLAAAVLDLIDNSIDGARRLRGNENFAGLRIAIVVNGSHFSVSDNCGGIPLHLAKNHAFKFGRDEDGGRPVKHSVGNFGVGMKRTLFKVANHFVVKSTAARSRFELDLNVNNWKEKKSWVFPLKNVIDGAKQPSAQIGTEISVKRLKPEVAGQFGLATFRNSLRERLRISHLCALSQGMSIEFNGKQLKRSDPRIRISKLIRPYKKLLEFTNGNRPVHCWMLVGIDERDFPNSGWYVFCNGRLLLHADRTKITGWGAGLVKAHQQFDRFRGYVFLDSNDASALPWNSAKTGFSEDAPLYRKLKLEMINAGRNVTEFLNKLRREEAALEKAKNIRTPLLKAVEESRRISIMNRGKFAACTAHFQYPKSIPPSRSLEKRISYFVEETEFEEVANRLGTRDAKLIGRKTFDYYCNLEIKR